MNYDPYMSMDRKGTEERGKSQIAAHIDDQVILSFPFLSLLIILFPPPNGFFLSFPFSYFPTRLRRRRRQPETKPLKCPLSLFPLLSVFSTATSKEATKKLYLAEIQSTNGSRESLWQEKKRMKVKLQGLVGKREKSLQQTQCVKQPILFPLCGGGGGLRSLIEVILWLCVCLCWHLLQVVR